MIEELLYKFKEEASDLINDLETALLVLEENPKEKNQLSQVFRVMHSLKGTGAMFGFEKITSFTHNLENIYDDIKSNKIELTKEIFDLTLESVDTLRELLENNEELNNQNQLKYVNLSEKIENISHNLRSNKDTYSRSKISEVLGTDIEIKKGLFYVYFCPNKNIFHNGTNPLYLIDELTGLADSLVISNTTKIPLLSDYNTSTCYCSWEVIINGEINEQAIKEVFIFVEDDCEIIIKLLTEKHFDITESFRNYINDINKGETIGFSKLLNYFINDSKKDIDLINISKNEISKPNQGVSAISSIRVPTDKLDELLKIVSEMITTQSKLNTFALKDNNQELIDISENISLLTRQLRDNAYKISLIPVNTLLTRFQRLVRDLSSELNKDIIFETIGGETELDKKIVEAITDPILHILRNCIDHGIEERHIRRKKGKSEKGKIRLKAYYSGSNVVIQIRDDGAGIDLAKVKQKAIDKNLISADSIMGKRDIFNLLFLPGFSTTEKVTDISGRGVGMDVVRKRIAEVRGEIDLDSIVDKGTVITLKLPLTLSIIDGLLVEISGLKYIIPLNLIHKIYAFEHSILSSKHYNLVEFDGVQIPYLYLKDEFELEKNETLIYEQIIVVNNNDKLVGLVVDKVIGEYQAVVKPLGKIYLFQELFSGATILGDGSLALIMDANKIIRIVTTNIFKKESNI